MIDILICFTVVFMIVTEGSSVKVDPGGNTTLLCSIKDDKEVTWIITNGNQTFVRILSLEYGYIIWSTGISCILLLIHIISIVNGGITRALEGDNITLSCTATGSNTEEKTDLNALWKKETGQRLIWKYLGEKKTAETLLNKFDIGGNLSLIINKCNRADQGVYILCIDGKPSCKVRLLITEKRCRRSADKTCSGGKSFSDATEDLRVTDKNNQNESPANQRKGYVKIGVLLFLGITLACLVVLHFTRKETTKNDPSEHKVLNPPCTNIQIN